MYAHPPFRPLAVLLAGLALGGCGGQSSTAATRSVGHAPAAGTTGHPASAAGSPSPSHLAPRPQVAALVVSPAREAAFAWQAVARIGGQVAVQEAQRSGVTLLRFNQQLTRLALHAGEGEPSGTWHYGARIGPSEIHRVVAAFNGGFKFGTAVVGWMSGGRTAVPLQSGRGSIVTYRDGTTAIGAWHEGVPAAGRPLYSVLQNLSLLVDHGVAAANIEGCIQSCWGATVGGVDAVARSALGIAQDGELVWGAGVRLVPATLARALIGAGVQRAVQLDINPDWVAGYLYVHGGSGPTASPVVPEQLGISGRFLKPYSRDFFTVLAR